MNALQNFKFSNNKSIKGIEKVEHQNKEAKVEPINVNKEDEFVQNLEVPQPSKKSIKKIQSEVPISSNNRESKVTPNNKEVKLDKKQDKKSCLIS